MAELPSNFAQPQFSRCPPYASLSIQFVVQVTRLSSVHTLKDIAMSNNLSSSEFIRKRSIDRPDLYAGTFSLESSDN